MAAVALVAFACLKERKSDMSFRFYYILFYGWDKREDGGYLMPAFKFQFRICCLQRIFEPTINKRHHAPSLFKGLELQVIQEATTIPVALRISCVRCGSANYSRPVDQIRSLVQIRQKTFGNYSYSANSASSYALCLWVRYKSLSFFFLAWMIRTFSMKLKFREGSFKRLRKGIAQWPISLLCEGILRYELPHSCQHRYLLPSFLLFAVWSLYSNFRRWKDRIPSVEQRRWRTSFYSRCPTNGLSYDGVFAGGQGSLYQEQLAFISLEKDNNEKPEDRDREGFSSFQLSMTSFQERSFLIR